MLFIGFHMMSFFLISTTYGRENCSLKDYFYCGDNGPLKCVSREWLCDGHPDCENGKDEFNCQPKTCLKNEFLCNSGTQCIANILRCEGNYNCVDKSDEKNCNKTIEKSCNSITEFDCNGDGEVCIPIKKVCDKINDCGRNQDEQPGGSAENCQRNDCRLNTNGGCSEYCTNHFTHIKCHCKPGYKLLSDNKTCEEIDECSLFPLKCSQICKNTPGGYSCSCFDGYQSDSENPGQCIAKGGDRSLLVVIRGGRLIKIDLNTHSNSSKIMANDQESWSKIDVDLHKIPQTIFWSKLSNNELGQTDIDLNFKDDKHTTPFEQIISPDRNDSTCSGLSFDWLRGLLFWTSAMETTIYVTRTDLNITSVLLSQDLINPRSIAVDPINTMIYWVDWGNQTTPAKIERMLMTSKNRTVVVHSGLRQPSDLTIDYYDQKLYWSDVYPGSLTFIYLNKPTNPVTVLSNKLLHPFSIVVFENKIYWSDSRQNQVVSADKSTGDNYTVLARIVNPYAIRILHKLNQPLLSPSQIEAQSCLLDKVNPCSHICLPFPPSQIKQNGASRFKCLCPVNSQLSEDKLFCVFSHHLIAKLKDSKRFQIICGVLISLILIVSLSLALICVYICRQRSWAHSNKGINRKSFKQPIVSGDLMFIFKCHSHSSQLSELLVSDVSSTITA